MASSFKVVVRVGLPSARTTAVPDTGPPNNCPTTRSAVITPASTVAWMSALSRR